MGAGHAEIALKRRAIGENFLIGSRDVGMRTDDARNAAIQKPAHELFVASRFGVKIDHADFDLARDFREHPLCRLKRTIDRLHEDAAHQANYRHTNATARSDNRMVAARRIGRVVRRFDDVRFALQRSHDLGATIDMVA